MNATLRTIDGHAVLRFERQLPHPPEKVWRALTEPQQLSRWFPSDMEMELAVGARIRFVFRAGAGPTLEGEIIELDPPRVFAYTWGEDSTLRWELRPTATGCLLVFTHTFDDRPSAASFAAGWQTCIGALEQVLDQKPVHSDDDHASTHEAYFEKFGLLEGSVQQTDRGAIVRFERNFPYPADLVWDAVVSAAPAEAITAREPVALLEYTSSGEQVHWELQSGPPGTRVTLRVTGYRSDEEALAVWRDRLERLAAELAAARRVDSAASSPG